MSRLIALYFDLAPYGRVRKPKAEVRRADGDPNWYFYRGRGKKSVMLPTPDLETTSTAEIRALLTRYGARLSRIRSVGKSAGPGDSPVPLGQAGPQRPGQ